MDYSANPDRDHLDQPGYISGTASGVATPRPSGTDKRFPGILHSYFGQVGAASFDAPSKEMSSSFHSRADMNLDNTCPPQLAVGELPTAPASPTFLAKEEDPASQLDRQRKTFHLRAAKDGTFSACPTPPSASPPSSFSRKSDEASGGMTQPRVAEIFRASRPKLGRLFSETSILPLRSRSYTYSAVSNPLSNITTNSSVHAAHLSNPTNSPLCTVQSSPKADAPSSTALSSLTSHLEMVKLTEGMIGPDVKATPPITPRTLSNDGNEAAKPSASPSDHSSSRADSHLAVNSQPSRAGPPVPAPKGKLVVKILGARGLRPSYDPYAVCAFEWIESIAHGHTHEDLEMDTNLGNRELLPGGVPIKRTGSDTGRSMAIPMRSRQGSHTSLTDQKEFKQSTEVTAPQWDHEAVL